MNISSCFAMSAIVAVVVMMLLTTTPAVAFQEDQDLSGHVLLAAGHGRSGMTPVLPGNPPGQGVPIPLKKKSGGKPPPKNSGACYNACMSGASGDFFTNDQFCGYSCY